CHSRFGEDGRAVPSLQPASLRRNRFRRAPEKRRAPPRGRGSSRSCRKDYSVFFLSAGFSAGFSAGGGAPASFGHTTLYWPRLTLSRTWIWCLASSCAFIQSLLFLVR